jgi:hypothetical protein
MVDQLKRSTKNRQEQRLAMLEQLKGWYVFSRFGDRIENDQFLEIEICDAQMKDGSHRWWIEPLIDGYENICVIEREVGSGDWQCGIFPMSEGIPRS